MGADVHDLVKLVCIQGLCCPSSSNIPRLSLYIHGFMVVSKHTWVCWLPLFITVLVVCMHARFFGRRYSYTIRVFSFPKAHPFFGFASHTWFLVAFMDERIFFVAMDTQVSVVPMNTTFWLPDASTDFWLPYACTGFSALRMHGLSVLLKNKRVFEYEFMCTVIHASTRTKMRIRRFSLPRICGSLTEWQAKAFLRN